MGAMFPIFLESTMNAEQLLPLVLKAQADGTRYLVLPNHFIDVNEALQWKASYERKLTDACRGLEQYRGNPTLYGVVSGLMRVEWIVRSAAHDFCIYLRDLGILLHPAGWPQQPGELDVYPEFRAYWEGGFASARAQLYSDPD
jgi:hypothetical protein